MRPCLISVKKKNFNCGAPWLNLRQCSNVTENRMLSSSTWVHQGPKFKYKVLWKNKRGRTEMEQFTAAEPVLVNEIFHTAPQ